MEKKGYNPEAKYLSIVQNWRQACDERGLSSDLRSQFNRNLLDYILDELIPWHKETSDLSLLEVNRYKNNLYDEQVHVAFIDRIRGFSRETLIALAANIETREWRRQYSNNNGIAPEHPRASTTDDVECFFSVLRDTVGKDLLCRRYAGYNPHHKYFNMLYLDVLWMEKGDAGIFEKTKIHIYPSTTIHRLTIVFTKDHYPALLKVKKGQEKTNSKIRTPWSK